MERCAGVLCPMFSVPANQGIGDLGQKTVRMIDCIADAGYHVWQILPLQAKGRSHSPYHALSSFAGDPIYINLDRAEDIKNVFERTIDPEKIDFTDKKSISSLVEIFKDSQEYNTYLMKKAAKDRVLVSGYLKQEIDQNEKFAVVEYYGRGFTQDCMVRLWQDIVGEEVDVPFYYSRSVLPTMGNAVRYNFTTNNTQQYFLAFANDQSS